MIDVFESAQRHAPRDYDCFDTLCILLRPEFAFKHYMSYVSKSGGHNPDDVLDVLDSFWFPFSGAEVAQLTPVMNDLMRNARKLTVKETEDLARDPNAESVRHLLNE